MMTTKIMIDLILVLLLTMMMVMMMTMTIMIDLILVLVLHISVKLWVASVPAILHLNMVQSNHDDDDVRIMRIESRVICLENLSRVLSKT